MSEEEIDLPVLESKDSMARTLYVERFYNLPEFGNYNNIKFSTAITKIPEELALNPKVIELMYIQQFLGMEIAYRQYLEIHRSTLRMDAQEALETLKSYREKTLKDIEVMMEVGEESETTNDKEN